MDRWIRFYKYKVDYLFEFPGLNKWLKLSTFQHPFLDWSACVQKLLNICDVILTTFPTITFMWMMSLTNICSLSWDVRKMFKFSHLYIRVPCSFQFLIFNEFISRKGEKIDINYENSGNSSMCSLFLRLNIIFNSSQGALRINITTRVFHKLYGNANCGIFVFTLWK